MVVFGSVSFASHIEDNGIGSFDIHMADGLGFTLKSIRCTLGEACAYCIGSLILVIYLKTLSVHYIQPVPRCSTKPKYCSLIPCLFGAK